MGVKDGVKRGRYNNEYNANQRKKAIKLLKEQMPVAEVSRRTKIKATTLYTHHKSTRFIGNQQKSTDKTRSTSDQLQEARNRAVYDLLTGEIADGFFSYRCVTSYARKYPEDIHQYIESEFDSFGISKNVSIEKFIDRKYDAVASKGWHKLRHEELVKAMNKYNDNVWFVMFYETSYPLNNVKRNKNDSKHDIKGAIVTITQLSGKKARFMGTKTGISAKKITGIIETLKKSNPGKLIQIVILDDRIDHFMSLKKTYRNVVVELPFVDNAKYEQWLQMGHNRAELKKIKKLLKSYGDVDQVASLTCVPAEVLKLIRD